jgi:hypothetical protein
LIGHPRLARHRNKRSPPRLSPGGSDAYGNSRCALTYGKPRTATLHERRRRHRCSGAQQGDSNAQIRCIPHSLHDCRFHFQRRLGADHRSRPSRFRRRAPRRRHRQWRPTLRLPLRHSGPSAHDGCATATAAWPILGGCRSAPTLPRQCPGSPPTALTGIVAAQVWTVCASSFRFRGFRALRSLLR